MLHRPAILSVATGNPPYKVSQQDAQKLAEGSPKIQNLRPLLEMIYTKTGIEYRYKSTPRDDGLLNLLSQHGGKSDCADTPEDQLMFPQDGSFDIPLDQRLAKFKEVGTKLATKVATQAIQDSGVPREEIEKVIVVSSSGFLAPGVDCNLVKNLKLGNQVDRTFIGFMGCGGAINGLRAASDFALVNNGKKCLLVCLELHSLHAFYEDTLDSLISHALFGDGCAALVVGAVDEETAPKGTLTIVDRHTLLADNAEDAVKITYGPHGMISSLTKELPNHVSDNIHSFMDTLLTRNNLAQKDIDFWGVHPGGGPIIKAVQRGLGLSKEDVPDSWAVLREYGNMASPTVVFVLQKILKRHQEMIRKGKEGLKHGIAVAFSPGVSIEGLYLKLL